MLNPRLEETRARYFRMSNVLGAAFAMSVLMFGAMLFALPGRSPDPALAKQLPLLFGALGLADLAVSFVVKAAMLSDAAVARVAADGPNQLFMLIQRTHMVTFALAESIGIFGLLLRMLAGPGPAPLGLMGLSLVGMALHWPRASAWDAVLERVARLHPDKFPGS